MNQKSNLYKNPLVWNDSIWMFLYCCGFAFPTNPTKNQKKYFKLMIECLHYVLPCDMCKVYFKQFLDKYPIQHYLHKQNSLLRYIVRLRNYIMKYYEPTNKTSYLEIKNELTKLCLEKTQAMSMKNPKIWGNSTWFFLHCSSFNYPKNPTNLQKKNYKLFLISLQYTLPCELCRKHLTEFMDEHPVDDFLETKKKYINYVIQLHNHVNKKFNNKSKISLKEAKNLILQNCFYQYEKKQINN